MIQIKILKEQVNKVGTNLGALGQRIHVQAWNDHARQVLGSGKSVRELDRLVDDAKQLPDVDSKLKVKPHIRARKSQARGFLS